jgi:5'-3' exonuclease
MTRSLFAPAAAHADTVLAIDCSYMVFQRYLALVSWARKAGVVQPDAADASDPCPPATPDELASFGDSFRQCLMGLTRTYNVAPTNVVFMIDCSRSAIWRMDVLPTYKGSRKSPRDFPSNVFPHFYGVVLPELKDALGVKSLACPRAEADDIAYVLCRHYRRLGKRVQLATMDSDYAQLAGPGVSVRDLKGNCILEKACRKAGCDADAAAYLRVKICVGDASDGITSIRRLCGPKTALKLARDPALLAKELENPETRRKHDENARLIDLSRMPDWLEADIEQAIRAMDE